MMSSNPLFPLCCYMLAILALTLAGSWAINHVRSIAAPAPIQEVQL